MYSFFSCEDLRIGQEVAMIDANFCKQFFVNNFWINKPLTSQLIPEMTEAFNKAKVKIMNRLKQHRVTEGVKQFSGKSIAADRRMFYAKVVERKDSEEIPHAQFYWVDNWKLPNYSVQAECGEEFTLIKEILEFFNVFSLNHWNNIIQTKQLTIGY